jgi:hypothetical protein
MTTRDKIGLGILIGLFAILSVILALTTKPWGGSHKPEDSIFIQQRMINLKK